MRGLSRMSGGEAGEIHKLARFYLVYGRAENRFSEADYGEIVSVLNINAPIGGRFFVGTFHVGGKGKVKTRSMPPKKQKGKF